MLFDKLPPMNITVCPSCKGTGLRGFGACKECNGRSMGIRLRGKWLAWTYPLTRFHIALVNGHRIGNKIRRITFIVLWLNSWIWAAFFAYRADAYQAFIALPEEWPNAILNLPYYSKFLFYLGVLFLIYFWYRKITERKKNLEVEKFNYDRAPEAENAEPVTDWKQIKKIPSSKRLAIDRTFTDEAMAVLAEAYNFADKRNYAHVEANHLFYTLLSFNRIGNIFIRLGLPAKSLQEGIESLFNPPSKVQNEKSMPLLSPDLQQILFLAYEEAYAAHQEYVSVTELLVACIKQSPPLQELLYDMEIEKNKLMNVVEWARIRERLYREYVKHARAGAHRSKYGMDKAMTALATPYLNNFSDDMTRLAQLNQFDYCVAREKEFEEIFRVVDGGAANVLLTGPHGVGKRTIVEGLADKMIEDDVPRRLSDKRLVRLNTSSLLSGTTAAGAIERLIAMMNEISRAGNVILVIQNVHELVGVSAGEGSSLDVAGTLADFLRGGRFLTIATSTDEDYARHIADSALGNVFAKVEIREFDENSAIQVLESKIATIEHKNQVFFAYDAVEKSVQLAQRFLHETCLPGSAIEIASEAGSHTRNKKGADSLVTGEEVAQVVADKTGIPATTVTSDESNKLMQLEEAMHKRVVGQDEAVDMVANALRRARVEIRSKTRPIANFLFMGPTGVGKTELAKTIADVYFGGENRMIRLDMSEYQDKAGIYRLIGAPGEKGSGILTEAIRRQPFALLLLDEIEKADPDILNLFLQVMDDGRLTDSTGRVVDFTNLIIIATTNAGTAYVQEQMHAGLSSDAIKDRLLHGELKQYFRPEFLNRFDGIVLFRALTRENIKQIAGFMLARTAKDLETKGIELIVEDAALEFLADAGYDPDFGARPMRRALQERVENKLAELLLSGTIKRRDKVIIGEGGRIVTA